MKIALHGFGTYPIVFRHLIETARKERPDVEWSVILPTSHHYQIMRAVLADDQILTLEDHLSRDIQPLRDLESLRDYPDQLFANIETEKLTFKHRPAWEQLARAAEIYQVYKDFLQRTRPDCLLIPQIEGFEGRLLPSLAAKLGILPLIPLPGRNLGGSFFCAGMDEQLPSYKCADPANLEAARTFIARFRRQGVPATGIPVAPDPNDKVLENFRTPLSKRALGFMRRSAERPDLFELEHLRTSMLNNIPWLRNAIWRLNEQIAAREFDVGTMAELPKHFIYYPLQVTPESSINAPAPYFVDQLRAIDALRFSMPNDHLLLVKEHPSAILTRPPSFVRKLRRRAGVVIAHHKMSSRALLERAALTVSVTGTATIEAFLLGRPSITLGPQFLSPYLGGVCPLDQLGVRIRQSLNRAVPDELVERAVAEIISVSYNFRLCPPGLPGEPALRSGNIARMFKAMCEHVERVSASQWNAA